jgi:hypothetical protein
MDFLLGSNDIRGNRIFCIRDVVRRFIAPCDGITKLLCMVFKRFRRSFDRITCSFGSVT